MSDEKRIRIGEASKLLHRREGTIRRWDRDNVLPENLRPSRDKLGHRYFTIDQIDGIMVWIVKTRYFPGRGLKNYDPSPTEIEKHITSQRKKDKI